MLRDRRLCISCRCGGLSRTVTETDLNTHMPNVLRGPRTGDSRRPSRRTIDPFARVARDTAVINNGRRDERSGTTVAMSRGMHRLLSNGCRDGDGETTTMTTTTTNRWMHQADPSLDCITAFPKWAIPERDSGLFRCLSLSLSTIQSFFLYSSFQPFLTRLLTIPKCGHRHADGWNSNASLPTENSMSKLPHL